MKIENLCGKCNKPTAAKVKSPDGNTTIKVCETHLREFTDNGWKPIWMVVHKM